MGWVGLGHGRHQIFEPEQRPEGETGTKSDRDLPPPPQRPPVRQAAPAHPHLPLLDESAGQYRREKKKRIKELTSFASERDRGRAAVTPGPAASATTQSPQPSSAQARTRALNRFFFGGGGCGLATRRSRGMRPATSSVFSPDVCALHYWAPPRDTGSAGLIRLGPACTPEPGAVERCRRLGACPLRPRPGHGFKLRRRSSGAGGVNLRSSVLGASRHRGLVSLAPGPAKTKRPVGKVRTFPSVRPVFLLLPFPFLSVFVCLVCPSIRQRFGLY